MKALNYLSFEIYEENSCVWRDSKFQWNTSMQAKCNTCEISNLVASRFRNYKFIADVTNQYHVPPNRANLLLLWTMSARSCAELLSKRPTHVTDVHFLPKYSHRVSLRLIFDCMSEMKGYGQCHRKVVRHTRAFAETATFVAVGTHLSTRTATHGKCIPALAFQVAKTKATGHGTHLRGGLV